MTNLCGFKFRLPTIAKATAPTVSDIGENSAVFWQNTSDNSLYLCFNLNGIIKKVELTAV